MAITKIEIPFRERRAPSAKTVRRASAAMRRDGAVAFTGLFPRPLLARLRREVLRRHESGELREKGLVRDIAGRYAAVVPFEGPFLDPAFYANPAVLAMIGALLGEGACIGSLEAVVAEPGAGRQHQHVDGPLRFDRMVGGAKRRYRGDLSDLPPYAVTLCVPLCDVTEENGPTAIWPGSHRTALRARPPGGRQVDREFPEERLTGKLGLSYFFDYRVFHGGTPNFTAEARPFLMFVFVRPWFRDPNLADVRPGVAISRRSLLRVPESRRGLFMLAPAARRELWPSRAS